MDVGGYSEKPKVDRANDKLNKAQSQLDTNKYDLESWSVLIREYTTRRHLEGRPLFEQLITTFPTAGKIWKIFIEEELKARNFERVENLFQRCLMKVLNIELWKLYLTYVKDTKSSLPTYEIKMVQAYDFALKKIGMDIQSYSIWNDYVNFLKGLKAVDSHAENQKINAIRKVYLRGVINPMIKIKQFWNDYISFEETINPVIAEKTLKEINREYMNASRVANELKAVTRGLNRNIPSIPPTRHPDEIKQVDLWKKYIAWEKANPLRTEDTTLITRRVMFAFEQCLLCLGHHPDIWYQATHYLEMSSLLLKENRDVVSAKLYSDEASLMYERATTTVLNNNTLLYFAYADFEEGRHNYDKVHAIYNRFLDIQTIDPTLAFVQYMKFVRRTEGLIPARTVFKRARKDPRSNFHVFVASALREYNFSKDKNIALRIFELGLKRFSDNPEYILCYIDYLSHLSLNENNNIRVLFERVLSSRSLELQNQVDIWNKYLEFESNFGDLASIVKVQKRRSHVLGQIKEFEGKETAQLIDRYKFLNLYPCSSVELRSIGYTEVTNVANKLRSKNGPNEPATQKENELVSFPKPDFSQMIPFKAKTLIIPGELQLPGGVFSYPSTIVTICALLIHPKCFQGPFVGVEKVMRVFKEISFPENPSIGNSGNSFDPNKLFERAKSVHWVVDESGEPQKKKRKLQYDSDDDDSFIHTCPPANDIYRMRQQKRAKKCEISLKISNFKKEKEDIHN